MEISITGALMPNVSGKILVYKLWGVGYQRFNANEHDKNRQKHTKIHTRKNQDNQINQINEIA